MGRLPQAVRAAHSWAALSSTVLPRAALALLGLAWTVGFAASGGVALTVRCHLFTAVALAVLLVAWPRAAPMGGAMPRTAALVTWLVGLGLLLGLILAPVIQLSGWLLAALAWSTWWVVRRAASVDAAVPGHVLWVLWGMTLLQALIGLWQVAAGEPGQQVVSGTLRNPNHFAGALCLGLGLAATWTWDAWRRAVSSSSRAVGGKLRWRELRWQVVGHGLAVAVLCAAIVASGSRGAMATAVGVLGFVVVRQRFNVADRRRIGRPVLVALGAIFVGWLGLLVLAPPDWVPRFAVDGLERRLLVYQGTAELIAEHPLTGVGPGLYRWRFRPYQRFDDGKLFNHAHNDYLQLAAEWGVPLALLLLLYLAASWWRACRRGGAVAAALLALLMHGWVDFDLQIPVLLMAVAALLALARRKLPEVGRPLPRSLQLGFAAGLVVLAALAVLRLETLVWAYDHTQNSTDPQEFADALHRVDDAPSLHFALGMLRRDSDVHRQPKAARQHLHEAAALNPYSWRYRFELGRFYERVGRDEEATRHYLEAMQIDPWGSDYQRRIGAFFLRRGEVAQGKALLAQSVIGDPRRLQEVGELLLNSTSPAELAAWWPRALEHRRTLLTLLCRHFEGQSAAGRSVLDADLEMLDGLWQDWVQAFSVEGLMASGDFYIDFLTRRGDVERARRRWVDLGFADPAVDAATVDAFAQGHNLVWNGQFGAPLTGGTFAWQVPVTTQQHGELVPGGGLDGSASLALAFGATPKADFKRLRQRVWVEPSTTYAFEYHLRAEGLEIAGGSSEGLFLQWIEADSRRFLARSEAVVGTTPWRHGEVLVEVPAGVKELVLRLARGPQGAAEGSISGRLLLDGISLRAVSVPRGAKR